MTNEPPATPLEGRLSYRCQMIATRITRVLAPMWQERYGLSVINWRVLAVIGRYMPVSAKDVVARSSTDPFFVSRAVEQLVTQGLVDRGQDPEDRRRLRLSLTAKGRRVHRDIEQAINRVEAAVTEGLSREERKLLDDLLSRLERRSQVVEATREGREFFDGR
jgi:DNA-binding MarR family transcriptional regulator